MGLPSRDEVAKHYLEGAEKHFDSMVTALTADIENLLTYSAGIDEHYRLDNGVRDLFEKLAAEQDSLEAVRKFRAQRGL